jgi:hypothetical protein
MKLNKYIASIAITALLGALTSFNDYLDKDPENSVPETSVDFTNLSNMYQPVSAVYAKIRTGAMHWVIWPLSIVRDDDVWSAASTTSSHLSTSATTNTTTASGASTRCGNQYYGIIKVANAALTSLDSYAENITSSSDMATKNAYAGEVRFLRAYAYYRLVQAFGPVTIQRTNSQTDLTRSTVESVYKYMLEDLQYTIDNTPKVRPNEMEHVGAVSAYSAMALAA